MHIHVCYDHAQVSYSFSNGGVSYKSRESITRRNVKKIAIAIGLSAGDDRCTAGGGNGKYVGYLQLPITEGPDEGNNCPNGPNSCTQGKYEAPFVCVGECAVGTAVKCWKPVANFVAADHARGEKRLCRLSWGARSHLPGVPLPVPD